MKIPEAERIFAIEDKADFERCAMELFRYQSAANPVYRDYLAYLGRDPLKVRSLSDLPFLPIGFFKTHRVLSGDQLPELLFESSGTTGDQSSKHYVTDPELYLKSLTRGFERVYGPPSDWCILALLPSYLEKGNSSLVYMMEQLMKLSGHPDNGFYLNEPSSLHAILEKRRADAFPVMLVGVSYALLDLAADYHGKMPEGIVVMETGGMKGRRKEMIRSELHELLKKAFDCGEIHSEYGMTELLSQAYSTGHQLFETPPWMKVLIRDSYDPFSLVAEGQTGGINVIDLANIHSCAFIATSDLGRILPDGRFEVLGRFDQAEVRGCNLMVS
ncbi:MAG: acyl transferase [Bacteroidota bacterium]